MEYFLPKASLDDFHDAGHFGALTLLAGGATNLLSQVLIIIENAIKCLSLQNVSS